MEWHSMNERETANALKTDLRQGLSAAEAAGRLQQYGKNSLRSRKHGGVIVKFFSQFADFMVLILLAAAGVSFFTAFAGDGDLTEPVMILLIVILNALVGTVQECRAEKAIDALKKLSAPHAVVIRGGKTVRIASEELVPGDLLCVEAGDLVCADARLIDSTSLKAEEAALTGESVPTEKLHGVILSGDAAPADRSNMIYSSTFITTGHGRALVVATGMQTQVGKIAEMINSEESPRTPLQKSLAKTGKILGLAALGICVVIFLLGMFQQVPPLEMFMIAISLAVAAIPEGLPAVVTIVLALGVRKMALHRAIVRHLPAVETLGSAGVICSDKTGTLTQNKMTVAALHTASGSVSAHSPLGSRLVTMAALCCNSRLRQQAGSFSADGDPTEAALVCAAAGIGQLKDRLDSEMPRVTEYPFDSTRKRMLTVHRLPTGGYRTIAKGAPDILLPLCTGQQTSSGHIPLHAADKKRLLSQNEALAAKAMRVLAVAYRDSAVPPDSVEKAESGLIFCGLIGMTDPPRPQAKSAVSRCKKAGILPVMITGDHLVTAKAVAAELGIFTPDSKAITGAELDRMEQPELEKVITSYSVFARVSPAHKVRIVKAFQSTGAVVAMTGDGINDAPALKCADIGCAMGKSGTDVAKNAADMILTDDNFATIVEAVEQGRGIFANIRKTVHFLLSSNIGEILTVLCAFLMHLPSPLLAMQLLWVNLVTDSMPALALGVEPAEPDVMERRPDSRSHSIFGGGAARSIVIEGCFIGALAFLAFTIGRVFFDGSGEPVTARTMTFAVLSLSQLVHAFNLRSHHSLFKVGLFGNMKLVGAFLLGCIMQVSVISIPFLASMFRTVPLSPLQWLIVSILSLLPLLIVETEKAAASCRSRSRRRRACAPNHAPVYSKIKHNVANADFLPPPPRPLAGRLPAASSNFFNPLLYYSTRAYSS